MRNVAVLSGRSHTKLASDICDRLGINLGDVRLAKFANQETSVEIKVDVREKDVFIIQTGGSGNINDHVIELLIIIQACKIASARRITAVIPCFPYSRQPDLPYKTTDTKKLDMWQARPGTLVANMLSAAGVDHIITMDLHDAQFQGFFDIPVDNLLAQPLMLRYIRTNIPNYQSAVVVSPDSGGAKRATAVAEALHVDFGLVHKERLKGRPSSDDYITFVGDVNGRTAIIVDDIIDTANTIVQASKLLKERGAVKIYAIITHGILSGDAVTKINESPLDEIVVSTSLPQAENLQKCPKLRLFHVAPLFAEAIRRIHNGESVSYLFDDHN